MGFADQYLDKQKGFKPRIAVSPPETLSYIAVIPVFCEPDVSGILESLWQCHRPVTNAEVILIINSAVDAASEVLESNNRTADFVRKWIINHNTGSIRFHLIQKTDFPKKDAGVGLARKTGMDEALYRFNLINKPDGIILSLDADCICDRNYFTAIEETVRKKKDLKGFTVYFEHPVDGRDFTKEIYDGITQYELHLRYVNQYLRFCGFPYAHHTVGSCFGVRADVYAGQGGMNKRKGGEDFYFLHKIIPLGNFANITTTRVIPSPRLSDRVPFGTGPAIRRIISQGEHQITYAPDTFRTLKVFLSIIPEFFRLEDEMIIRKCSKLPQSIRKFLEANQYVTAIAEINRNSAGIQSFVNRFYRWFDAFRIIKYLNFCAREYYPGVAVIKAAPELLRDMKIDFHPDITAGELLEEYRRIERGEWGLVTGDW